MLITNLSDSKRKALAKDIKALIEPNKAQTVTLLKETELRKFLKARGISANLCDVIDLLNSCYSDFTVKRLISKIQQSVVWDTSLSRLTTQKLGELLYCNPRTNIFLTSVLAELKNNMNKDITNATKFKYLYYSIISDAKSEYSTIVDYESNLTYTDNQILEFAQKNMYMVYTCDHTLGLRAKSRHIPVSIFNKITDDLVPKYNPVANGKNLILTPELIESYSLAEIIKLAHILHSNKFVLTFDFVEELERKKNNSQTREYINFFVYDEVENYTIFALPEDKSKYNLLCLKHNAIVLTSTEDCAILLKQLQIPYYLILEPTVAKFLEEKNTQITLATKIISKNEEESKRIVSKTEKTTAPALIYSTKSTKIPHYNPKYNAIRFKPSDSVHEKFWVLDDSNNEIKPNGEKARTLNFKALPGYFVIHGKNNMNDTYTLTVYKIITKGSFKTGQIIQSFTFTNEAEVPKEYKHYAAVLKMST